MVKLDEVKTLHLAYFISKEEGTMMLSTIEDTIQILDENYGTERTAEDLGEQ